MTRERRDFALQLLADLATEGLDSGRQSELDALLEEHPDLRTLGFEETAAALELAFLREEPMPAHLLQRIELEAGNHLTAIGSAPQARGESTTLPRPEIVELPRPTRQSSRPSWIPWLVAAAAVIFAIFVGLRREAGVDTAEQRPVGNTPEVLTPAERRNELLSSSPDLLRMEWTVTEDEFARGASGDVVWSETNDEGYMRISGLQINDRTQSQYQLWVFDKVRDDRYPVDGGVFDVVAGEVVIPIDPKIAVEEAVLFAITVEKPGGVVVSDRERIVLLAQKS